HPTPTPFPYTTLFRSHQHAQLQEEFERRGGYANEAEIGRVLSGLGFTETDRDRQTQEFSGGWQMRIALARLLLGRPDVLLQSSRSEEHTSELQSRGHL